MPHGSSPPSGSCALRRRRLFLRWLAVLAAAPASAAPRREHPSLGASHAPVVPGHVLSFPHDTGSHPDFRVEWWYVTGWLDQAARAMGFQVTFFRVRTGIGEDNPSAFAPRQLIIAHAALADPRHGRLLHDQRAARAAFGLAGAATGSTNVWLDDWSLRRDGSVYRVKLAARQFALELELTPSQPPIAHGRAGFSRKGPDAGSASYYYTLPHIVVRGAMSVGEARREAAGTAWLDHEWSSQLMAPDAVGWDWVGINLADGAALMAFRMRSGSGSALWAAATLRRRDGPTLTYEPDEVSFTALRTWTSARTGVRYPVSFAITVGSEEFRIAPLFDDQEQDARATTGALYWEGAVRAYSGGTPAGRGYLELTGYGNPLRI